MMEGDDMRSVICTAPGCENEGHTIEVPDAPEDGDVVICGPCGAVLENSAMVQLDEAQT